MSKSKHRPELIDLDDDDEEEEEEPGPSSGTAHFSTSLAAQPSKSLQRAANGKPANQTAMHALQPGSSAGPSRHARRSSQPVPIIDLSESEAAAGLPAIHGHRNRSVQRDSLDLGKHPSADTQAAAPGRARHPPAGRRSTQEALEVGGAGPLWLDADDIAADARVQWSASAAPKRRRSAAEPRCQPIASGSATPHGLENSPGSPSVDQRRRAPAKMQRVTGPRGSSRPQEILDLTGMGDRVPRRRRRQATTYVDLTEPHPTSARAGAAVTVNTAALASCSAATSAQAATRDDRQQVPEPKEPVQEPMLISSQDPWDLLGDPQQLVGTLGAVPGEPGKAPQGVFSCAICFDEHSLEDCYIASMCGHRMCRDAAREVVLGAVRSCSFPVLCPICQAKSDPRCIACSKREAAVAVAQEAGHAENIPSGPSAWCCTLDADMPLLLTVEEEEQYLERSLKAAANSCADLVPCPKPNCDGVAVAGAEDDSPALVCNACEHEWCGKCNVAWHSNKSCDEYQRLCGEKEADQGLEEYRKSNRMIKCPTCGHGIEKIAGCNRVQCSGCKTQCCWLCGKKLPATNPYSHFTSKGCGAVFGGAQAQGPGVPAGAWAALPGEQPGPHARAAQAAQALRVAIQRADVAVPVRRPARGLPAAPAPAQPAQQALRWPWPWPRPQPLDDVIDEVHRMLHPGAADANPAPAHVPPPPAAPHAAPAGYRRVRVRARARR